MSELDKMEAAAREIGHTIGATLPPKWGFVLMVFEFGPDGHLTYISNAQHEDMIATLKETIGKLEAGMKPGGN